MNNMTELTDRSRKMIFTDMNIFDRSNSISHFSGEFQLEVLFSQLLRLIVATTAYSLTLRVLPRQNLYSC